MKKYLENNCYLILHEVELSKQILQKQAVCNELMPLKKWLEEYLQELEKELLQNLYLLDLNHEDTFHNIFKRIQITTRELVVCNIRLLPSIHRYKSTDNVCLKLLFWLQNQHPIMAGQPLGIFDGQFMIAASNRFPTIYYLPNSSQYTLLHLPLFFHEIGHKFYAYHRPEMMELVKDFQLNILNFFTLQNQYNNKRSEAQIKKVKSIVVDTWTNWIEELFCDAVGVRIGGASYIHAFSNYLRMSGRAAFFKTEKDLNGSSHPVSWLRVKFLVKWAEQYGLSTEARNLEEEWSELAKMQGVKEKYFGFYINDFYQDVKQCLDDMLIVSEPIFFNDYDGNVQQFDINKNNFIELTNLAWRKLYNSPKEYKNWEQKTIEEINHSIV